MPYNQSATEQLTEAAAVEWVAALKDLPEGPIDWACRNWHTTEAAQKGFKPVPAQIYALAVSVLPRRSAAEREAIEEHQRRVALGAPKPEPKVTAVQAARILLEKGMEHLLKGEVKIRRMPPSGSLTYDAMDLGPLSDGLTADEAAHRAASRPYTDEERARMAYARRTTNPPPAPKRSRKKPNTQEDADQ